MEGLNATLIVLRPSLLHSSINVSWFKILIKRPFVQKNFLTFWYKLAPDKIQNKN